MSNPFVLIFGKEPYQYISRDDAFDKVVDAFEEEPISEPIFLIEGLRGTGKTVLLTSIYKHFDAMDSWCVVDLNIENDLLESSVAKLYAKANLKRLFLKGELGISFHGVSFTIGKEEPPADAETTLIKIVEALAKKGKRILFTIDEADNSRQMRVFAHTFQSLLRLDLPVFLAMTGLQENLSLLQNEKTNTFLLRAPKITLGPLSLFSIASRYQEVFSITNEEAAKLAKLTNGYAFAFQLLGHLLYDQGKTEITQEVLANYDRYLEEYVYDKVWEGLSPKDRLLTRAIAKSKNGAVAIALSLSGLSTNEFPVYRARLIKKGLVDGSSRGKLKIVLPRFDVFMERNIVFEDFGDLL